jgi:hypothetical protein
MARPKDTFHVRDVFQDAVGEDSRVPTVCVMRKEPDVYASDRTVGVRTRSCALNRTRIEIEPFVDHDPEERGEGTVAASEFQDWPREISFREHP